MKSYDLLTKIMKSDVWYDLSHPKHHKINISEDITDINENCIFREAGSEGDMMADHSSNNTPEVGKITLSFNVLSLCLEKFYIFSKSDLKKKTLIKFRHSY